MMAAELIRLYLPWLLSAMTIWMMVLAGNHSPAAWIVGLANQTLWLVWVATVGAWGLLPLTVVLTVVYVRNFRKWSALGQSSATLMEGAHEPE